MIEKFGQPNWISWVSKCFYAIGKGVILTTVVKKILPSINLTIKLTRTHPIFVKKKTLYVLLLVVEMAWWSLSLPQCYSQLHYILVPNPKKLWLINQSMNYLATSSIFCSRLRWGPQMTEALAIGEEDAAFLITSILLPPASLKISFHIMSLPVSLGTSFGTLQGFKRRQWPINLCTSPMMIQKINPFND